MNLYDSKTWISDLDEVIQTLPELSALQGARVMITGCTGLICSAVCDILIRWNETHERKIGLLAAGRNEQRVRARFAPYDQREWFAFVPYDAASPEALSGFRCDYIIHGASNASPDRIVQEPVETMMSNFMGLKRLLDHAREDGTRRVLFVSSSEVYGRKEGTQPFLENEYGYIDLLNARNSYSVGKRAAETLCASCADEYGADVVIVRPGHVYGPTATEADRRVSSAWAYSAARGEDIVMKSSGSQIRSYCYCLDNASAILKVLLQGENKNAYNISNPDSVISIRGMAEILTRAAGVTLRMEEATEAEKKGFNPMNNSSLNSEKLMALGWKGTFDAEKGFTHTIAILREIKGSR